MLILVAPDSFKGSLSAPQAAAIIADAFRAVLPSCRTVLAPLADGGEGTLDLLVEARRGALVQSKVTGPLGEPVDARFGLIDGGGTAVIEVAEACGLPLVPPDRRDPLRTTTAGVGDLIRAALDRGARQFIVGLGGTSTNDGGAGMLQALGARMTDATGRVVGPGGGALARIAKIDMAGLDPRIAASTFRAAYDVDRPLTGPDGASRIFGPQKGASPAAVELLEAGLQHYADRIADAVGTDARSIPGGGAAGGLGAALAVFLGAELRPGADLLIEALDIEPKLAAADIVVTGEGQIDGQTMFGKAPGAVMALARRHGKPVIVLAGAIGTGLDSGSSGQPLAMFSSICRPGPVADALAQAEGNLSRASRNAAMAISIGMSLR